MKSKILLFLFLGMLNIQAQTGKKPVAAKKPAATTKPTTTTKPAAKPTGAVEGIFATFLTNKGTIVLQLEFQKTPVTVANFISLVEGKNTFVTDEKLKGKPFYDGLKFHRVIADFMIQGGDPSGTGAGGAGYAFKDEFTDNLKFEKGGILAMANSGPGTNGSQFFITHKETPWLNGRHTIFGHVTKGMDIVNLIKQDDIILKVTISKIGTLAKQFDAAKVFSDYFTNKGEDEKKQALLEVENNKKKADAEAEAKKMYEVKYASVITAKSAYLSGIKATATTTPSGLIYKITQKGTGSKPADGTTFNFNYSGYFEDGNMFDSNYPEVCKAYGKYDSNRDAQGGYRPFPFEAGKKDGMIPGFIEGLGLLSYGDKAILFIPSNLAYGETGAGGVIPPNATIIFEIEMIQLKSEAK
ncbi:peptidylprolyl isomerase [Flavobacterium cellulosilyticum]|uniref:peptidylprolyl isomerase n=1 Tax=Flavobacterium cellulosilyticum TaxID=2541731 RepID=A0A4R5CAG4_9FLAO|nr:peptidylprolyl isomerase [Flavobacterium cellulosilyticum]TDD96921.1 peptidylprolyl isomerase [Flavobacterium cellulosilyticum]